MSGYVSPEDYLGVLDGRESIFEPDSRFSYCNGGFVVLALLAQRASDIEFHELVRERVIRPAGLTATDYLRSDQLPGDAAVGYVQVDGAWRTNVFVGMDAGSSFAPEHRRRDRHHDVGARHDGHGAWGVGEALGIDNL